MGRPAYQERVIDELTDLDGRHQRLADFMRTEAYRMLPMEEQARMSRQFAIMGEYAQILTERITAFPTH